MKPIVFLLTFIFCGISLHAQLSQSERVSQRISSKMQDSLGLSEKERQSIHVINEKLQELKMVQFKLIKNHDSLTVAIQRIENSRDSLYRAVLAEETFNRYRSEKNSLISNN